MLQSILCEPLRQPPEVWLTPGQLDQTREYVLARLHDNLATFGEQFPGETCVQGYYPLTENIGWTSSFWTGQLWLGWELSGDARFYHAARHQVRSFGQRIASRQDTNTHDLGFLYTLSCVADWRLNNNREARGFALLAADALLERYHPQAQIVQAWGDLDDPAQAGRMIIDCNMNLPLLYWASEQTGDRRYAQAAQAHLRQAVKYLVRPDASSWHTYYMDPTTGAPRFGNTQQGYSDDSCWSRGQAWGIYGFLLSFNYTGDPALVGLSKRLANYFLNRLPEDGVCHWDLALAGSDALRDASAAAIAVCGLLELVKHLPVSDPDRASYQGWALHILNALTQHYLTQPGEPCNGLLKHSVYHLASNKGVDECCSWGDYFYLEALTRASRSWQLYW